MIFVINQAALSAMFKLLVYVHVTLTDILIQSNKKTEDSLTNSEAKSALLANYRNYLRHTTIFIPSCLENKINTVKIKKL